MFGGIEDFVGQRSGDTKAAHGMTAATDQRDVTYAEVLLNVLDRSSSTSQSGQVHGTRENK